MNPEQRERYSRQILFSGIQEAGQERLLQATAAIVGCGALGTFHAAALARAGVGRLILIDRDFVESSNLQRQWLFDQSDADHALPKAIAAKHAIGRITKDCQVEASVSDLNAGNIDELLEATDLILDGTDNFETRYLINDYSVRENIPWIYGGAVGSYGIVMPVEPNSGPCFRCVYPEPPGGVQPTCDTAGVLNTITALVASLQVSEALKILSGRPERVSRKLTTVDVWSGDMRQIGLPERVLDCPCCGQRDYAYLEGKRRAPVSLCGRNAVQIHEKSKPIDLDQLAGVLRPLGAVRSNGFALRFEVAPYELTVFPDGRAIIKGTTDVGIARSLYSRYIGG